MHFFFTLKPFYIYNLILILIFSIIVNFKNDFYIFYYSLYCLFHFLLIYLFIYHNRKILFLIYFIYGLCLDIFWFNEIGPHLLSFMTMIIILRLLLKYLYNFNSLKIYFFLVFFQILTIFFEIFLSKILLNVSFDLISLTNIIFLSLILSIPVFLIFSKIDEFK